MLLSFLSNVNLSLVVIMLSGILSWFSLQMTMGLEDTKPLWSIWTHIWTPRYRWTLLLSLLVSVLIWLRLVYIFKVDT